MYITFNIDQNSDYMKQVRIKLKAWFNIDPEQFPNILKAAGVNGVTCVMQEPPFEKWGHDFFRVIITVTAPSVNTYCLEVRHSPSDEFQAEFILTDRKETKRFFPKISYVCENMRVLPPDPYISDCIDAIVNPNHQQKKKRRFF